MTGSLNQITYNEFKKDIMTLALRPGEQVSAMKVAERYNVSRTPAREALVKLEAEGLIDIHPQSKSVISKIDVKRAKQEWFIRKTLELGMVDALFDRVMPDDITKMRFISNKMKDIAKSTDARERAYEYLQCDLDFHSMTYIAADQELAADVIGTTMAHYNRIRILADLESFNKERTVNTHEQMLRYLETGEKESYRTLLARHLGYITQDIVNLQMKDPTLFKDWE